MELPPTTTTAGSVGAPVMVPLPTPRVITSSASVSGLPSSKSSPLNTNAEAVLGVIASELGTAAIVGAAAGVWPKP